MSPINPDVHEMLVRLHRAWRAAESLSRLAEPLRFDSGRETDVADRIEGLVGDVHSEIEDAIGFAELAFGKEAVDLADAKAAKGTVAA